jgi:hypothetical protein
VGRDTTTVQASSGKPDRFYGQEESESAPGRVGANVEAENVATVLTVAQWGQRKPVVEWLWSLWESGTGDGPVGGWSSSGGQRGSKLALRRLARKP